MAECGECTLCCKLLGVAELDKPPSRWCHHCTPGKGCNIYADRPPNCVDFECGWFANDGSPEHRPDRLHMIVTGESQQVGAYVVHVDPGFPDAPLRPAGKAFLEQLATRGRHANIILVTGERRRFMGRDPTLLRRRLAEFEASGAAVLS